MTAVIINDIFPYTQAIAVGSQTVYSTDWTANYASDVVVYSTPFTSPLTSPNDVTQILSSSQYSVAFIGGGNIVQVTLVTPSTAGDIVTITRQTPADRENLYTNTNFVPSMLNNDFGILTLVDQQAQLVNQLIGPRYNYSAIINPVVDTILPILAANQLWVKNPGNTAIIAAEINTISAGSVNLGAQNDLAWYSSAGTVVSGLATANSSGLLTNSSGVPAWVAYTGTGAPVLNTSPKIIGGLLDTNGNSMLGWNPTASAVNAVQVFNNTTGNPPGLQSAGPDTNIALNLVSKGNLGVNVKGSTAADSAPAGYVGEIISSVIASGAPVSLTTATATNITQLTNLPAGDWDVWGNYSIINTGNNLSAGSGWISGTTNLQPDNSVLSGAYYPQAGAYTNAIIGIAPMLTFNLSSPTTVYLSVTGVFGAGTGTCYGGIYARRRR